MATKEKSGEQKTSTTTVKTTYQYEAGSEGAGRSAFIAARPTIAINRGHSGMGGSSSMSMQRSSGMMMSMPSAPSGAYQNISALGTANVQKNRKREKKDMQDLNERLASYIEKVRFLEAQNKKLVAELDDLRSKWGKETAAVKAMYEAELAEARKLLDESEKERVKLELRIPTLQEELEKEKQRNVEMAKGIQEDKDTIERQNHQLSDYEGEINLLRRRLNSLEAENKRDKIEIKRLMDELTSAKQDLDNETLNRICAENDKQSLLEELEFLKNVHEQEMKELAALAYRDTTAENREFWKNELSQAIHDIQVEYENKLDGMRGELSAFYDAKMQEFRSGATRQNMESTHAKEEVKKLRGQISDLRARLADLEAKNQGLEKLYNDAVRDFEEKEREWSVERSEMQAELDSLRMELEGILAELQNLLDAKLSLELEIAAYRKLLEGEETRVSKMSGGGGGGGSSISSSSVSSSQAAFSSSGSSFSAGKQMDSKSAQLTLGRLSVSKPHKEAPLIPESTPSEPQNDHNPVEEELVAAEVASSSEAAVPNILNNIEEPAALPEPIEPSCDDDQGSEEAEPSEEGPVEVPTGEGPDEIEDLAELPEQLQGDGVAGHDEGSSLKTSTEQREEEGAASPSEEQNDDNVEASAGAEADESEGKQDETEEKGADDIKDRPPDLEPQDEEVVDEKDSLAQDAVQEVSEKGEEGAGNEEDEKGSEKGEEAAETLEAEAEEGEGEVSEAEGKASETEVEASEPESKASEPEDKASEPEDKASEAEVESSEHEGKASEAEDKASEAEGEALETVVETVANEEVEGEAADGPEAEDTTTGNEDRKEEEPEEGKDDIENDAVEEEKENVEPASEKGEVEASEKEKSEGEEEEETTEEAEGETDDKTQGATEETNVPEEEEAVDDKPDKIAQDASGLSTDEASSDLSLSSSLHHNKTPVISPEVEHKIEISDALASSFEQGETLVPPKKESIGAALIPPPSVVNEVHKGQGHEVRSETVVDGPIGGSDDKRPDGESEGVNSISETPETPEDSTSEPGAGGALITTTQEVSQSSQRSSSSSTPQKGGQAMKGEMSAKTTYQRSAKGTISIADCDPTGKFITFENTGKKDESLDGWRVTRKIEGKPPVNFKLPNGTTVIAQKKQRIYSQGNRPGGSNDPEADVKTMGQGGNIQTILMNTDGEERATHTQRTTYSS